MKPFLHALALTAVVSCTPRPVPEPVPIEEPEPVDEQLGPPVAIAPQFAPPDSGTGCVASGETTELRGTILVKPFGKGADGIVLYDGDQSWVVSYDGEDRVLRSFHEVEVLARGRPCEKEEEAVDLPHFELKSLRAIGE
jgi:hypothetical protein